MIADREARAQALRLSALDGFEANEQPIAEALQRSAGSLEHASRIVSAWLKSHRFAPLADDIRALAGATDPEDDRRNWRCAACEGTGFATVYELHTWRDQGREDVERISYEHYQRLQDRVSGIIGEQTVAAVRIRCEQCKLGRERAEAERRDRAEKQRKAAEKTEKQRRQPAPVVPVMRDWNEREEN